MEGAEQKVNVELAAMAYGQMFPEIAGKFIVVASILNFTILPSQ